MKKNISNIAGDLEELASLDFLDLCPLGETGTGKTHTGKLVHDLSPRSGRPMVSVNCAELSTSLIESEQFGHEKGAFTGQRVQTKASSRWRQALLCFSMRSVSSRRRSRQNC